MSSTGATDTGGGRTAPTGGRVGETVNTDDSKSSGSVCVQCEAKLKYTFGTKAAPSKCVLQSTENDTAWAGSTAVRTKEL